MKPRADSAVIPIRAIPAGADDALTVSMYQAMADALNAAQAEPAGAARPVVELPLVHVVGKRVAPAVERTVVELPRVEIVVNRSAASAARVADKSANGEKPRAPRG